MSLLLDALKKSEAQRRRGRAPTIDLTMTSPSGGGRRPGIPWWVVLLIVTLLTAAAVWLWPGFADWTERNRTVDPESVSVADSAGAPASGPTGDVESPSPELDPPETPAQAAGAQRVSQPSPVAGASNERRIARVDDGPDARSDSTPMVGQQSARIEEGGALAATRAGPTLPRPPVRTDRAGAGQVDQDGAAADVGEGEQAEAAEQATATQKQTERPAQAEGSEQADGEAAGGREPSRNFIRPWELPQAQRAEFPELMLTVHFFAKQPQDRFVLINGERYAEGQQVGPGVRLVEIRRRGAVVEFGSYRVLIE